MTNKKKNLSEEYRPSGFYAFLRVSSTFGISLAVSIYVLSHLLGGWIDAQLGTGVLFRIIFLFMSLVSAGYYLYKCVVNNDRIEKELKEQHAKDEEERASLEDRVAALKKELKQ